jgi:hypothetical protein
VENMDVKDPVKVENVRTMSRPNSTGNIPTPTA